MGRHGIAIVIGVCFFALMSATGAGAAWEAADTAWGRYESERTAAGEALARQDMPAAERHADAARGHLQAAKAAYEKAGVDSTRDAGARGRYVEVLGKLGFHDLAAARLEVWIAGGADSAENRLALGEALLACGPARREAAFGALVAARDTGSETVRARALARLGDLYYREGLFEHAADAYDAAAEADSGDVETRIALAALVARAGDLTGASAALDAIGLAAQPHDAFTRERLRDALHDYDARRRWFADTAENHRAHARLLYRAARAPEAVVAARRAAELDAGDAPTWNFLAAMHAQLGQTDQAAGAYAKSLDADPDQPQVRAALDRLRAPDAGGAP